MVKCKTEMEIAKNRVAGRGGFRILEGGIGFWKGGVVIWPSTHRRCGPLFSPLILVGEKGVGPTPPP